MNVQVTMEIAGTAEEGGGWRGGGGGGGGRDVS